MISMCQFIPFNWNEEREENEHTHTHKNQHISKTTTDYTILNILTWQLYKYQQDKRALKLHNLDILRSFLW